MCDVSTQERSSPLHSAPEVPRYPSIVFLELTRRCNGRCIMCGASILNDAKANDMSFALVQRLAEPLLSNAHRIELRGRGESTLYERLEDVLLRIGKLKTMPTISLTTNGYSLTPRVASALATLNAQVSFSFDGATPEIFDTIRRGLSFHVVLRNVSRYVAACADPTVVSFVVTVQRQNCASISRIVELAADLGIGALLLHDVEPRESALRPDSETLAHAYAHAANRAADLGVCLVIPRHYTDDCQLCLGMGGKIMCQEAMNDLRVFPDLSMSPFDRCRSLDACALTHGYIDCSAPWTTAFITSDGQFALCCKAALACGSVLHTDAESLWHGRAALAARRMMMRDVPPAACAGCMYKHTGYSCPSLALGSCSAWNSPDR